ncbi:MAG: glycosyl hydrolase, partial [Candidatus Binataceae bacterium]
IYRLDRPGDKWVRIGRNMPKEIGDIGFGIVVHPRDPDSAWVFPMDGTEVWPRTALEGKPAVYRTRDAGKSWERHDRGLPRDKAWYTVLRQAFVQDGRDPLGIYFGTTSGELWMSRTEGQSWMQIAGHLQRILSVTPATFA